MRANRLRSRERGEARQRRAETGLTTLPEKKVLRGAFIPRKEKCRGSKLRWGEAHEVAFRVCQLRVGAAGPPGVKAASQLNVIRFAMTGDHRSRLRHTDLVVRERAGFKV